MFRPCWNIDTERNNKTGKLHHELQIFALRLTFPKFVFIWCWRVPSCTIVQTKLILRNECCHRERGPRIFQFQSFELFQGGKLCNNEDHNLFNCPAYVKYFCQIMFSFHFGRFLTFTWNEITNFCHFIISYKSLRKYFSLFFHLWW